MASVRKRKWEHKGEEREAWVVSYTDPTGKRRLKTFERKKEADAFRNTVAIEVQRGEYIPDKQTITVSAAVDQWLEHCEDRVKVKDRIRPRTVNSFRCWVEAYIRPKLGHLLLTKVTHHTVQQFVDELAYDRKSPKTYATISNVLVCLRLTIKLAYARGQVARHVMKDHEIRIPGKKGVRDAIPSKQEIRSFLEASAGSQGPGGVAPYLRPLLYCAVFSGLRQGELRGLTWANVDFDKRLIRVRHSMDTLGNLNDPKTAAGRRDVPMAPELVTELRKWKLKQKPNKLDLVFASRGGRFLDYACVHQSWNRLQFRVENGGRGKTERPSGKYTFHSLRHVCASLLIESGLPPKRIQTIMGHSSVSMTFDTYGHLFDDPALVDDAFAKIGRGLTS